MDIVIDKPARLRGYPLHRIVAEHLDGKPALWADEGTRLRIRPIDAQAPRFEVGKLLAFTTMACVALRDGRRHRYLPTQDWRARREWFDVEAAKHGFVVLGVHVKGGMQRVETHDGRNFTIDASEFTGLLRITDPEAFASCLTRGIGRVGKAFGLGMLCIQ